MNIAILGRTADTLNYVRFVRSFAFTPLVTLEPGEVCGCSALLLPGGGDITPAFFGEQNHGSRNIDTELDILQLQAFDLAVRAGMPVLGICKGMQIINVGLGGSVLQDLGPCAAERHRYDNGDRYHGTLIKRDSWLHALYRDKTLVNSAHHQALARLGRGLSAVQCCPEDGCIEAVAHSSLPIIGVQWHPERIDPARAGTDGGRVLDYFSSLCTGGMGAWNRS